MSSVIPDAVFTPVLDQEEVQRIVVVHALKASSDYLTCTFHDFL